MKHQQLSYKDEVFSPGFLEMENGIYNTDVRYSALGSGEIFRKYSQRTLPCKVFSSFFKAKEVCEEV